MGQNTGYWIWHDLMTSDPAAAKAFYGELFGWDIRGKDMGGFSYDMIHVDGVGQGGFVPLDPEHGVPNHWIGYLAVEDVDAFVDAVEAHGGKKCVPPTDIPSGRFAVVEDPSGAVFSPFKPLDQDWDLGPKKKHGQFCWDDLAAPDPDAVLGFFKELAGWSVETFNGAQGPYHVVSPAGATGPESGVGGVMARPPQMPGRPMWTPYVKVDDVEATTARAVELGATLNMGPYDAGETGKMAFLTDPTGASFALHQDAS